MRLPMLLLLMVSVITPSVYGQGSLDAIANGLTDIDYDFGRWPYPLYAEVTARLQELAAQHPEITNLQSIGETAEGRDIWLMEITSLATGPGDSKPGLWIDRATSTPTSRTAAFAPCTSSNACCRRMASMTSSRV